MNNQYEGVKDLIEKYKELWNEHSPFDEPVPYTSMVEEFVDFQSHLLMYGIDFELRNGVE